MKRSPFRQFRQFFQNLQIRKKLIICFSLLIVLPVTLMTLFYLNSSRYILEKQSSEYTSDILTALQKNIEYTAVELDTIFIQITNDSETQALLQELSEAARNGRDITEEQKHRLNTTLKDIYYSHPTAESIYLLSFDDHGNFAAVPEVTVGISEEHLNEIQTNGSSTSWLRCDDNTITYGKMILSLEDAKPLGYLIINLSEKVLFDIYSEVSLYKDNSIFITDKEGRILSHGNKEKLGQQVSADYFKLFATTGEPLAINVINGAPCYTACRSLNNNEWYLFYQTSVHDFESDLLALIQAIIVISVFILVLSLLVAVIVAKTISNPITQLTKTMQQVRNGNFEIRNNYNAKDEIGILSDSFNTMVENTNELIQTIYQKELLKQEAELRFLKFQINPHFLYNTLETINWISRIRGVPEAGEIAKALGDLMREGLRDDDFVPLKNEIRNIENYLLIQQYRYGEKIKIEINIDPSIEEINTPKFILQPIIENALVHGLDSKIDGGNIRIFGGYDEKDIILMVEDDGVGMPEEIRRNLLNENLRKSSKNDKHTHIGILNVHKRLRLYFGPQYGLSIYSELGAGTVVTIRIPREK